MNMVMNNDFGADFVRKMHERKTIEKELEKIANMQQRNAKYNIYVTKAQALRNEVTAQTIHQREVEKAEAQWLEDNHIPNGLKASPLARSMSLKSPKSDHIKIKEQNYSKASQYLPPLKQAKND